MRMRRNEGKREKILAKETFYGWGFQGDKIFGTSGRKGHVTLKQWSRHIERNPSVPTLN